MSFRVDKYLWCVRLAKTRTQATELIVKGKVRLNGEPCKPAREVKSGDQITVLRHNASFSYRVLNVLDKRVGPKLVEDYLVDETTEEERNKYDLYRKSQEAYRHQGEGKPNKKQRRDLDDFLESW